MLNARQTIFLSALALVAFSVGTPANAMSQEEQLAAAQWAYEESAKDYEEAAEGFQEFHDAAVAARDLALELLSRMD